MLQQNVNNIESISIKAIMDMKYHKAGNPEEESRINMVEEMIKVKVTTHLQYLKKVRKTDFSNFSPNTYFLIEILS